MAVLSGSSWASVEPKVEITSFGPVDARVTNRLAEVCGKVTGATGDFIPLRVTPDYDSSNPANYMTFASHDGTFCQVIMTLYGNVQVTLAQTQLQTGKQAPVFVRAKITQVLNP